MNTKKASSKTVTVKVNEENPEPLDVLAKSIIDVSEGFERINNSRLNRKAIVLLLQNAIGAGRITQRNIEDVLDYAPRLKNLYTKSAK
jgi:hypothetical protein